MIRRKRRNWLVFYGESKILAVKARGQCVNLVIINSKSAGQILVQSINRDARTTFMDPVVLSLLLTLGRLLPSVSGVQLSYFNWHYPIQWPLSIPSKTSENQRPSVFFRRYRNKTVAWNGLRWYTYQ